MYLVCPKCKNGVATQRMSHPEIISCSVCGEFRIISTDRTFAALVKDCTQNANNHGWHISWRKNNQDLTVPEALCLIHSEISEALEAYRDDDMEEFKAEVADVFIRLFHLVGDLNISIEEAILAKMEENRKRPFMHGRKNL